MNQWANGVDIMVLTIITIYQHRYKECQPITTLDMSYYIELFPFWIKQNIYETPNVWYFHIIDEILNTLCTGLLLGQFKGVCQHRFQNMSTHYWISGNGADSNGADQNSTSSILLRQEVPLFSLACIHLRCVFTLYVV